MISKFLDESGNALHYLEFQKVENGIEFVLFQYENEHDQSLTVTLSLEEIPELIERLQALSLNR